MPNFSQILMLQIAFLFSSLLLQSGFDAAAAEKNGVTVAYVEDPTTPTG